MAVFGPTMSGDDGDSWSVVTPGASPCVCVTTGVTTDELSVNVRLKALAKVRERLGDSLRVRFFFLWDVALGVGGIA
jgi:hypothetical protein